MLPDGLGFRPTPTARLERWLGAEEVGRISDSMRDWYGPPIPIRGVPGAVFATKGGDFVGPIKGGGFATLADFAADRARMALRRWSARQARTANAGFASLSDLLSELAAGKGYQYHYQKVGTIGVVAATNSLWRVGNTPPAGAAAAAAPGGTVPTSATTGAMFLRNPTVGGDTQHLIKWEGAATVAANTLLLYDRIFAVAKTMSSTALEAVTGVPTRYASDSPGDPDYAAGNFLFVECGTALGATAHNWTVCTYTDQDGNAGATLPSLTGNSSNIANRLDHPVGQWFAPLAAGDSGLVALTQMQCSASVTGAVDFVIGHPLAFFPAPVANQYFVLGMINDAVSMQRIYDNACLAFLEVTKPATGATTYNGTVSTACG